MQILYALASSTGSTVVTTIHSPSKLVLKMSDRVYLMAKGRLVYNGGYEMLDRHLDNALGRSWLSLAASAGQLPCEEPVRFANGLKGGRVVS